MTNLATLTQLNAARWARMTILPSHATLVKSTARRLAADGAKAHYLDVSKKTKVPWAIIAVIHERESSQSWKANLAQGDPWNEKSIHVPKWRGPFQSWDEAAIDALTNCAPEAASWTNWSIGGALTLLEQYNGLGYANRGLPSPYIWGGTSEQVRGKYVADGHFDPDVMDTQIGCAALLSAMMKADSTITFVEKAA